MRNLRNFFFLSLLLGNILLLTACASSQSEQSKITVSIPSSQWWQEQASSSTNLAKLAQVRARMLSSSQLSFDIAISTSSQINAHASRENGLTLIIFNQGFLDEFGNDSDILATTLGHELAHHQLGHTAPGYVSNHNTMINVSSQAFGMLANYFIPFSGLLVGNGIQAAGLSYSRDDERAADQKGMDLAMQAGYSPCGSYRLSKRLDELNNSTSISFLSSHPGNSERMANAQKLNQEKLGSDCKLSKISGS
jgi:predicted Zn-dependent protease